MSVLLRKTNGPDRAGAVFTDQSIDSGSITVGSSTDADIRVIADGVAPLHCTIKVSEASSKLSCSRGNTISVADNPTATSITLVPGESFTLAGHKIEAITPPAGFDLALRMSLESAKKVKYERLYKTELSQTKLSPRLLT